MKNNIKNALASVIGISIALLALAACGSDSVGSQPTVAPAPAGSPQSTVEALSGRNPNASVSGSVTYRERLALSPDAKLVVSLWDVTYQDSEAPLIARQTIKNPGQVPIKFKVEYDRDDIDSRNIYSVSAEIIEADGRLAFTNDTAYEVITRGKSRTVDMLLVIVQPPPDQIQEGTDWRQWVEVPARVIWANLIPNEPELFLRIGYYQSTIENCARPGSQSLELEGDKIIATLTLMQPPPTSWAILCDEELVELDAVEPIRAPLEPGKTYHVIVNDVETTSFRIPGADFGHTIIAESPVESLEIMVSESALPEYRLHVISGLPKGSGCSQFNGYEVRRPAPHEIEVVITHHEVADPMVICTADFPILETTVPLGSGFEMGEEYTVRVNSDAVTSFIAR